MAPYRKLRSILGAIAVGMAAATLSSGCMGLPESCKLPEWCKLPKWCTESKLGKAHKKLADIGKPSVPVMPKMTPPADTPPPASALNLAPGAPPPGPPTIWAKLGLSAEQREYTQRALAEKPIGKLMGAAMAPLSKLSHGVIPPLKPPTPTLAQLLDKGPIGASSKVKMDKLNAKSRKEAIEELKDVDCHYWPEAEEALIAALRTDRNEGVRYTAATTLASGKCCTKKTMEALIICVSGSDRDGAPCEVSATVRAAAKKSLEKCLANQCLNRCGVQYIEIPPCPDGMMPEEKPREEESPRTAVVPAVAKPSPYPPSAESEESERKIEMAAHYTKVRKRTVEAITASARDVVARVSFPPGADGIPAGNSDYEAVELYPDVAPPISPRPEGIFDRQPAIASIPAPKPATPRDPSRPLNVLDMLTAPRSTTTPAPVPAVRLSEPPRATPSVVRPAALTEERTPAVTVERGADVRPDIKPPG